MRIKIKIKIKSGGRFMGSRDLRIRTHIGTMNAFSERQIEDEDEQEDEDESNRRWDEGSWRGNTCLCTRIGAMNLHAKEPLTPSASSGQAPSKTLRSSRGHEVHPEPVEGLRSFSRRTPWDRVS